MNEVQRELLTKLRAMDPSEAEEWIIKRAHDIRSSDPELRGLGDLVRVVSHMSWRRSAHDRLGNAFLCELPHGTDYVYRAMLKFMSVSRFIWLIQENLPEDRTSYRLLVYYLKLALADAAKNQKDKSLVERYLASLEARQ